MCVTRRRRVKTVVEELKTANHVSGEYTLDCQGVNIRVLLKSPNGKTVVMTTLGPGVLATKRAIRYTLQCTIAANFNQMEVA